MAREFGDDVIKGAEGAAQNEEITDGVAKYLSDYDYTDGVIPFEEEVENESGEKEMKTVGHSFADLSEAEKYDVLKTLSESKAEGKHELSEDELKAVTTLREKAMSFDDLVNSEIEREVTKVKSHYDTQSVNYADMDNDTLMTKSLQSKYKDETPEQIQERLTIEKDLEGYDRKVQIVKDFYIDEQKTEREAELSKTAKEIEDKNNEEIESHRKKITNDVIALDKVAGWRVSDEDKKATLDGMLEIEANGNTVFYNEIFGDPIKMFEAAYLYKNANALFDRQDSIASMKLNKAVAEAKKAALNGSDIDTNRSNYSINTKQDSEESGAKPDGVRVFGE